MILKNDNAKILITMERFSLQTTYPGLFLKSRNRNIPIGKSHFKNRFSSDINIEQPIIPGSLIKGVCRSIFGIGKDYNDTKSVDSVRFILREILKSHENDLQFQYYEPIINIMAELSPGKINALEMDIFGDKKNKGKDVFFDAILDMKLNKSKEIFVNDFITPHYSNLSEDPIPIQSLKVNSGIAFEFTFNLCQSFEWTSKIKCIFFKQVLLTLGIGPKMNLGYGSLKSINDQ